MPNYRNSSSAFSVDSRQSQSMPASIARYVIASLVLDTSLRRQVLKLAREETKCLAPELGLDLEKLAYISSLLEAREITYSRFIALVVIVTAVLMITFAASGFSPMTLALGLLVVSFIQFRRNLDQARNLVPLLRSKKYHDFIQIEQYLFGAYVPETPTRPLASQGQNLVVYSGFVPFVGAGTDLGGWSFPVNISRPRQEFEQPKQIEPFELSELYSFIDVEMNKCEFKAFTSQDYLFVNGKQIRGTEWILPDIAQPPILHVEEEYIEKYLNSTDPQIRYYKWMQIMDWDNEIVLSYFLRFSMPGEYLFIEINRFLLPPLDNKYRRIDLIHEPDDIMEEIGENIGLLIASVFQAPFTAISSIITTGNEVAAFIEEQNPTRRERRRRKKIIKNAETDYGAVTTLRNDMSSSVFNRYFQKLDQEMYVKVFESQLLESIADFLEAHNIDVSDIKERQDAILNTGIIMQGGELKADSLAVGAGAKSSVMQQVSQRIGGLSGTEAKQ